MVRLRDCLSVTTTHSTTRNLFLVTASGNNLFFSFEIHFAVFDGFATSLDGLRYTQPDCDGLVGCHNLSDDIAVIVGFRLRLFRSLEGALIAAVRPETLHLTTMTLRVFKSGFFAMASSFAHRRC
jgi:hypothetical protein